MANLIKFNNFVQEAVTDEELRGSKVSALQSAHINGTHMNVTIHSGHRAHERRPDMNKEHWNSILTKTQSALKNKKGGHYLLYSKKHSQGIVVQHLPHVNKVNVMTILPKGKQTAKEDTNKIVVEGFEENFEFYEDEIIWI